MTNGRRPGRAAVQVVFAGSVSDAINPRALDLLRGNGQAKLLLQRPGEGAAHRVRLPAGGRDDLRDGGALLAPEHRDQLRLLGVAAGLAAQARRPRPWAPPSAAGPGASARTRPAPRRRPWARRRRARRPSWCPR